MPASAACASRAQLLGHSSRARQAQRARRRSACPASNPCRRSCRASPCCRRSRARRRPPGTRGRSLSHTCPASASPASEIPPQDKPRSTAARISAPGLVDVHELELGQRQRLAGGLEVDALAARHAARAGGRGERLHHLELQRAGRRRAGARPATGKPAIAAHRPPAAPWLRRTPRARWACRAAARRRPCTAGRRAPANRRGSARPPRQRSRAAPARRGRTSPAAKASSGRTRLPPSSVA